MTEEAPAVDLAVSELRRSLDVGLANVDGQLALLHQLHSQADGRLDRHARLLDELEERLAAAEREQVTPAHLDNRLRNALAVIGLLVTAASVLVSTVVTVIGR